MADQKQFLDVTLGNVIVWIGLLVGVVTGYVKLKDQVGSLSREQKRVQATLDNLNRVLEELKTLGTPSSRVAIQTVNSMVTQHHERLLKLEEIYVQVGKIQADIAWIRDSIRDSVPRP